MIARDVFDITLYTVLDEQAKMVSNKDVLAMTGSLGSISISVQTTASTAGSDGVVTIVGVQDDKEKLAEFVDKLKETDSSANGQKDNVGKGTVKGPRRVEETTTDQRGDLLTFALQMPSSLHNIIDFDVHCR